MVAIKLSLCAALLCLQAGAALAQDKWAAEGFSAEEARKWQAADFGTKDALKWKQAGFEPDSAALWKKEKFSPAEAGPWRALKPGDAARWKKAGAAPSETERLMKAGWDGWDLDKWRRAGFDTKETLALVEAGFAHYLLDDARGWKKLFPVTEVKAWRDAGFLPTGQDSALKWKKAGFKPEEAGILLKSGFGDYYAEQAVKWRNAGFTVNEAGAWRKAGFGELYSGAALDWKKAGFTPEEAGEWLKAGFSESYADAALNWKKTGFTLQSVKAWLSAGFGTLDSGNADKWRKAGFTPEEIKAWGKAGFSAAWDLEKALAWKKEGFSAKEAKTYRTEGLTADQSAALAKLPPSGQLGLLLEILRAQPDNLKLTERIIKLYGGLETKPSMPEEAGRFMGRGVAAMKEAKSAGDYREAAAEFRKAVIAAPWYAAAFYNLAGALGESGDYAGAARNLKFYLLAAPDAGDAPEARALMYEMEFKAGKAEREEWLSIMKGPWHFSNCNPEVSWRGPGCTKEEEGSLFWRGRDAREFVFPGNGTLELPEAYASLLGETVVKVVGTPSGPGFQDLAWECRYASGRSAKAAKARNYKDAKGGETFELSCDYQDDHTKSHTLLIGRLGL